MLRVDERDVDGQGKFPLESVMKDRLMPDNNDRRRLDEKIDIASSSVVGRALATPREGTAFSPVRRGGFLTDRPAERSWFTRMLRKCR